VTHHTLLNCLSPAGRPLLANGPGSLCPLNVSWFGWNRRFLVPAMRSDSVDGTAGSRIAAGNRRSRRVASLNQTAHPRDHGMTRGLEAGNSAMVIEGENSCPEMKKSLTADTVASW
jgi:hypothetical protein